jgi:mono/diheme cytochrome c family protein
MKRLALVISLGFALSKNPANAAADTLKEGKAVYGRYCLSCHGPEGDGNGYAAQHLDPRPRNFTTGLFKWRSTPSGEIPRDEDLLRTVSNGLWGTAMPSWQALSPAERRAVIAYVKTFSPRFEREKPSAPLVIPPSPPVTRQTIEAGAGVYQSMGCAQCHGAKGHGDGQASLSIKDDWNRPLRVYDLTSGHLKCGNKPEDVYRVFMTGLNGTPMPSFAETLKPEEAWSLVHFILSIRQER